MTRGVAALMLSAAADLLGGVATDRTVRRLGLRLGRITIGGGALAAAGVFTMAGAFVASRGQRGDEYLGAGGIDPQSDPRRGGRAGILAMERAALSDGRVVPARCALLAVGRPDEARF
jgi:hypothetical protein